MKTISPELFQQALKNEPIRRCQFPEETLHCLIRAWRDPAFTAGWETLRDQFWLDPPDEVIASIFHSFIPWEPDRQMLEQVVRAIDYGYTCLASFHEIPKLTPSAWQKFFANIENTSAALSNAIGQLPESFLQLHALDVDDFDSQMAQLSQMAKSELENGGLARPNAIHADRTYVAKGILENMLEGISPTYATIASLLNAMFPDYEPIDAGFVQSVARKLPKTPE